MLLATVLVAGKTVQRLFLGSLRFREVERLHLRIREAVIETCLAMTVFRDDFNTNFILMFGMLLFLKVFHWLAKDRIEFVRSWLLISAWFSGGGLALVLCPPHFLDVNVTYGFRVYGGLTTLMSLLVLAIFFFTYSILSVSPLQLEEQPLSPRSTYVRLLCLMLMLFSVDARLLIACLHYTLEYGRTMVALFAFEFTVLLIELCSHIVRFTLHVVDVACAGRWEGKAMVAFYAELVADALQLVVYVAFFVHVLAFYPLPIHILRDLYVAATRLQRRVFDFMRYRRVVATMSQLFADATPEELAAADATCIICREEMVAAKKLACGHIFHARCLQSWLKRQLSCPTCRAPVDVSPSAHRTAAAAAAAARAANPGAAGAAANAVVNAGAGGAPAVRNGELAAANGGGSAAADAGPQHVADGDRRRRAARREVLTAAGYPRVAEGVYGGTPPPQGRPPADGAAVYEDWARRAQALQAHHATLAGVLRNLDDLIARNAAGWNNPAAADGAAGPATAAAPREGNGPAEAAGPPPPAGEPRAPASGAVPPASLPNAGLARHAQQLQQQQARLYSMRRQVANLSAPAGAAPPYPSSGPSVSASQADGASTAGGSGPSGSAGRPRHLHYQAPHHPYQPPPAWSTGRPPLGAPSGDTATGAADAPSPFSGASRWPGAAALAGTPAARMQAQIQARAQALATSALSILLQQQQQAEQRRAAEPAAAAGQVPLARLLALQETLDHVRAEVGDIILGATATEEAPAAAVAAAAAAAASTPAEAPPVGGSSDATVTAAAHPTPTVAQRPAAAVQLPLTDAGSSGSVSSSDGAPPVDVAGCPAATTTATDAPAAVSSAAGSSAGPSEPSPAASGEELIRQRRLVALEAHARYRRAMDKKGGSGSGTDA